jgi:hypothetical protein
MDTAPTTRLKVKMLSYGFSRRISSILIYEENLHTVSCSMIGHIFIR